MIGPENPADGRESTRRDVLLEQRRATHVVQIQRLIDLDFHTALGFREDEYRAEMAQVELPTEEHEGMLQVLLDPRIPLLTQMDTISETAPDFYKLLKRTSL